MSSTIGLIGLGVMGHSLAINFKNNQEQLILYDKDIEKTKAIAKKLGFEYETSLKALVHKLPSPKIIILMVPAGNPIDTIIEALKPYLDAQDIIIDCGNSHYKDTERRQQALLKERIHLLSCGMSGGEKGALEGPSLMVSGNLESYHVVKDYLLKIAAKNDDGTVCCDYVGSGGAGHFVKMVHNAIEYAEMQLIADIYSYYKYCNMNNKQISETFEMLNNSMVGSYLFEISKSIINYKEASYYLLDKIDDVAKQKGTGKWSIITACEYNVSIPSLSAAVDARFTSELKDLRHSVSTPKKNTSNHTVFALNNMIDAILFYRLSINAQGLDLIKKVSQEKEYNINLKRLTNIWRNGCIIKSHLMDQFSKMEDIDQCDSIIKTTYFSKVLKDNLDISTEFAKALIDLNLYTPVISNSLQHVLGMNTKTLSTNLIQAQRDYFGAHGFRRNDISGVFTNRW